LTVAQIDLPLCSCHFRCLRRLRRTRRALKLANQSNWYIKLQCQRFVHDSTPRLQRHLEIRLQSSVFRLQTSDFFQPQPSTHATNLSPCQS